ncbi:hypothetical protein EDC01DRAFT_220196 [Geopyxis carbonaria]|nr:hypothetical protein EDC01DRAFT_220196 [Geopyxis carbonaria]
MAYPQPKICFGTLHDTPRLGAIGARAQFPTMLAEFYSPHRHRFPADFAASATRRMRARMLSRKTTTLMAVADGGEVMGYVQYARPPPESVAHGTLEGWMWAAWDWVVAHLWKDRSLAGKEVLQAFYEASERDEANYWGRDEYKNHLHVQSVMVDPGFQRRGVGKALMREVLKVAEAEGVPVGLEAGPQGALLYHAMGFRLLGPFSILIPGEEYTDGAGVMVWEPERRKGD